MDEEQIRAIVRDELEKQLPKLMVSGLTITTQPGLDANELAKRVLAQVNAQLASQVHKRGLY